MVSRAGSSSAEEKHRARRPRQRCGNTTAGSGPRTYVDQPPVRVQVVLGKKDACLSSIDRFH
jgi:hypothetical protein